jgi:flagellar hook-associated protein 2
LLDSRAPKEISSGVFMGTIISSGIGSGIDINGLVTQLVTAEGQAKSAQLDAREAVLQGKISAYGSLRSAIDSLNVAIGSLKNLTTLQGRAVSVGDRSVLTASADSTAATGSYQIEVQRLAAVAKLQSTHFATADTVVGTGTLTIKVGTSPVVLDINSSNNSLTKIRDAINGASGNPGVTATIITALDGAHLVLTGTKTGAANAITVTATGGLLPLAYDPANSITNLTPIQQAVDSRVLIDGLAAESASNAVTTAISGITLNLLATSATNVATTLSVSTDQTATTKAINAFATAYNSVVTGLKPLGSYDATTKIAGPLLGDSTLRDFLTAARRAISANVNTSSSLTNVSQVGVSFAFDGTMSVDATKLGTALDGQFDAVGKLFASTDGVATRLDALLAQYTSSTGLINARTQGLQSSISDIGDSRKALQTRLDALSKRLHVQFNAMDTLVQQLRSTSTFLSQQLTASSATLNGG